MAWKIHILIFFLYTGSLSAQVPETDNPVQEEQLEQLSEKQDKDVEDDSYWQELESLRKHPIHLNHADAEELRSIGLLTDLQISNFIEYRTLLGDLINVYELQAIPAWDLETIRRLLPFVRVGEGGLPLDNFDNRWKKGESSILLRASQVLEKSRGYFQPADATVSHYLGSPQHMMFRYDYRYRQLLQFGLTGDKDAGEQFFRGAQKLGFDFYSFHLFSRQSGLIRTLALGDFTVNLGQGLIQWQSLAFSKSAEVLSIKRQAAPLRPYNSPGEFKFHRGIGLTLVRKNWSATLFFSTKKISTNLFADTLSRDDLFSSLESSGYHRTKNEIEDRNNTGQMAEGMNISYSNQPFHLGFNLIHFQFSRPFQKQDRPYNLFAIQGRSWTNSSIDYSYTYRNLHFFGESAIDPNRHGAFLNAVLISLGARADLALLHRYIHKEYQALYADAFTENSSPTNENGIYMGLNLHPTNGLQAGLYLDMYKFPWLRFQVDGPGWGREYFIQLIYRPNKDWTLYSRYKAERKSGNLNAGSNTMHIVQAIPRQDWRTEFVVSMNRRLKIRSRIELLWYDKGFPQQQEGFLGLIDVHYQARSTPIGGNIRVQWVETSGYASRIYVFENDPLYSYSLPAFYDKSFSYYINVHLRIDRLFSVSRKRTHELSLWMRWGQSFYPEKRTIGSGLDEIIGHRKSELKIQLVSAW